MAKEKTKNEPKPERSEKTKIFSYKGYIGIDPGTKLVNDPTKPGELGCVAFVKDVEIDQGAYDMLQTLKKIGGSFATIMCFDSCVGACLGWMGYQQVFKPSEIEGDRDYNPSLLKTQIVELELPADFKEYIDTLK